ncbi:unnamed protein product [Caenorhabditis sp. 36 PRJEB53466]|nr:unnamed protein product [Caenorhabditis sp. 36 PRJEB53466]
MMRNTIGVDKVAETRSVEFRMPGGRSVRADIDRLCVLGMTKFPSVIDVTQMEESASKVLEQLITGNRKQRVRLTMNQAAEIAHVAVTLKFGNLLKLIEKELVRQASISMENSVDGLCVALRFGMMEAVGKLVDDIVFSHLDENLLMYCKSAKALEMITDRKSSLLADQEALSPAPIPLPVHDNLFNYEPIEHSNSDRNVAIPRQNRQMHKVIMNAAKEKFRVMFNRPMNAFKSGIGWIANQTRLPQARPRRFANFHEQFY